MFEKKYFNFRAKTVSPDSLESQLRHMRRALGLTPVNRVRDLESDFEAVEAAARATELAYYDVVGRLRQNDLAMQESLYATGERKLSPVELQELHNSAAIALQPDASEINTAHILSQRLRSHN